MLRDFTSDDQAQVQALVDAGMRERWGDAYDPACNPDLDDLTANYVDGGAQVVVLELDGRIVASGILVPESTERGRILRMSVDAQHRREGHGARLVDELVRRARACGMTELVVRTDTPWTSALAMYRSCGFDEVGDDGVDTHFSMSLRSPDT